MSVDPPALPMTGLLRYGRRCKDIIIFIFTQNQTKYAKGVTITICSSLTTATWGYRRLLPFRQSSGCMEGHA